MSLRCDEIFNDHFVAYFLLSVPVKEFWKFVKDERVSVHTKM